MKYQPFYIWKKLNFTILLFKSIQISEIRHKNLNKIHKKLGTQVPYHGVFHGAKSTFYGFAGYDIGRR